MVEKNLAVRWVSVLGGVVKVVCGLPLELANQIKSIRTLPNVWHDVQQDSIFGSSRRALIEAPSQRKKKQQNNSCSLAVHVSEIGMVMFERRHCFFTAACTVPLVLGVLGGDRELSAGPTKPSNVLFIVVDSES